MTEITAIVLAAGKGTRMKSSTPKVLHEIAHVAMLGHVLDAADRLGTHGIVLVVAPGMADVENYARTRLENIDVVVQMQPLGTADAVKAALPAISGDGVVLIMFGDTPLLRAETLSALVQRATQADVVVLGFEAADPSGYGRLVLDWENRLTRIVEHKDASEADRAITLCNGGAMAVRAEHLSSLIGAIGNDNAAGEFYLPDVVAIANSRLVAMDRHGVTFCWKDYRARSAGKTWRKTMTLTAPEFIRRFLLHVLPRGFHRIRHYGLLAGSARKASLALARRLLEIAPDLASDDAAEPDDYRPPCPCCGGHMVIIEAFERWRQPRAPPAMTPPIREVAS